MAWWAFVGHAAEKEPRLAGSIKRLKPCRAGAVWGEERRRAAQLLGPKVG
jgi:hypothetical protein